MKGLFADGVDIAQGYPGTGVIDLAAAEGVLPSRAEVIEQAARFGDTIAVQVVDHLAAHIQEHIGIGAAQEVQYDHPLVLQVIFGKIQAGPVPFLQNLLETAVKQGLPDSFGNGLNQFAFFV